MRKVLLILLLFTVIYTITFSGGISSGWSDVVSFVNNNTSVILWCCLGAIVILAGHVVRAWKMSNVFDVSGAKDTKLQFKGFAIGSLFNLLLPFKFGEVIRADFVAQKRKISFTFSFLVYLLERACDAILLCLLALCFGIFNHPSFFALLIFSIVIFVIIYLLVSEPKYFTKLIYKSANVFSEPLRAKILFTIWSAGYGLKKIMNPKKILLFIGQLLLHWALYISGLVIILSNVYKLNVFQYSKLSISNFVASGSSFTAGGLGNFSTTILNLNTEITVDSKFFAIVLICWISMNVPLAVIGLFCAIFKVKDVPFLQKRTIAKNAEQSDTFLAADNKILRNVNIADNMLPFMEGVFQNNKLAKALDSSEEGEFSLLRYFNGGSNAITLLGRENIDGEMKTVVKKLSEDTPNNSLHDQYLWLARYSDQRIVKTYGERKENGIYELDIAFEEGSIDGFDYVHSHSDQENQKLYEEVVDTLFKNVYVDLHEQKADVDLYNQYIQRHIFTCLEKAAEVCPIFNEVQKPENIIINGKEYLNLKGCLDKINNNKKILDTVLDFRTCEYVHGDVIVDNIIYSSKNNLPIILDPVPKNNFFIGPVFDFGKIHQSIDLGYEWLLRNNDEVKLIDGNKINYFDDRSQKYKNLITYIKKEIEPKYLTENERKSLGLHAAVNYFRRLKYQVKYRPENALKFYAVGVKALNEWIQTFE
ncbi:MAG: flippase-like domain-containing protein [Candidatus Ancillula sp.]|jgi:hypothetical protein|nr:flippase-like domain-containing protein [Candidatus Ancillula sp.]